MGVTNDLPCYKGATHAEGAEERFLPLPLKKMLSNGLNKALLTKVFTANTSSINLVLNYVAVVLLLFTVGSKQALTSTKWPKHEEYNAT